MAASPDTFSNRPLDVTRLPNADDVRWRYLSPRYRIALLIRSLLTVAFLAGAGAGIYYLIIKPAELPVDFSQSWPALGALGLLIVIVPQLAFRYRRYAIRERDMQYRTGFWRRRSVAVPINRIQHVEITSNPIDRMLGLSRLQLFTAGSAGSDLQIPGLETKTAEAVRQFLLRAAGHTEL